MYEDSFSYIRESKNYIYSVIFLFLIFGAVGFLFPTPESVRDLIINFIEEILAKTKDMSFFEITMFIFWNNFKSSFLGMIYGIVLGIFLILIIRMRISLIILGCVTLILIILYFSWISLSKENFKNENIPHPSNKTAVFDLSGYLYERYPEWYIIHPDGNCQRLLSSKFEIYSDNMNYRYYFYLENDLCKTKLIITTSEIIKPQITELLTDRKMNISSLPSTKGRYRWLISC